MPDETPSESLHLPDLSVSNFRGIRELAVKRLGRVTLLVGANGIGKTTVLDAVRVLAAKGSYDSLVSLLRDRQELISHEEVDDGGWILDPSALFYGRNLEGVRIVMGSRDASHQVSIEGSYHRVGQHRTVSPYSPPPPPPPVPAPRDDSIQSLKVATGNGAVLLDLSWFESMEHSRPVRNRRWVRKKSSEHGVRCLSMGPERPRNKDLAKLWKHVALSDYEAIAARAIGLAANEKVRRIAVVSTDGHSSTAIVRLERWKRPVPVKSLGDGAVRLFGLALALANSRDGFLLIDEAENGIHYRVQKALWTMVLQAAEANNVQVIATTHSFDCVRGLADAAADSSASVALVRLSRHGSGVRAVEYPEKDLHVAAERGIEVR